MRKRLGAILGALALFAALSAPGQASAAFGISDVSAVPDSTDAGANTNFAISIGVAEPEHHIRDLTIHLPPGLVGNPLAAPTCPVDQLNQDNCPDDTRVGTTSSDVDLFVVSGVGIPLTVSGDVYNLDPQPGEPARFGIVLRPAGEGPLSPLLAPVILQSAASLRPDDLGLDTSLSGLPSETQGFDTQIKRINLTLFGQAGNPPQGFIRLPTSCGEHTVAVDAVAYDEQAASGDTTFTTENCGALPFTPELTAVVKPPPGKNQAVELSTTIAQTLDEAGLKRAQVTLPNDFGGNQALFGTTCSEADFQASACPENTLVGSAEATSPLLADPLTGTVALLTPPGPGLPLLGVDLKGPLALKLQGTIGLTTDLRSQVVFDGLPDIPIGAFTLTFHDGPDGLTLPNRDICQPPAPVLEGVFASHAGGSTTVNAPAEVKGCGPSSGDKKKKPKAKIKLARLGSKQPRMTLKVRKGSERLTSVKAKLPRQLALASGGAFKRGTVAKAGGKELRGKKVKHSKHALALKGPKSGVGSFKAKLADGALRTAGKGAKKLKFKLRVRDRTGKTTKLTVRARGH